MNFPLTLESHPGLDPIRRGAWEAFQKTADPARNAETWRRVPFHSWRLALLSGKDLPLKPGPEPRAEPSPAGGGGDLGAADAAGVFRQDDSRQGAVLALDPDLAKRGVILSCLEEAAGRWPELVLPRLKDFSVSPDFRKLEAANLSLFKGGVFLYVPSGAKIEKPFHFSFAQSLNPFNFPRALVVAETGSESTVIEEHVSPRLDDPRGSEKLSSIAFSHVVLGPDARMDCFYHQSLSTNIAHFWHQRVELAQDARLRHYSALSGAGIHKSELDVRLAQPGARSQLYGILFGSKDQIFDPHTVQDHRAPRTMSDLLYRIALRARARSIYTGLIRVEKQAKGSEAFQQNDNILLSNEARADSTPVLEILTDEVRCKHGATAGPVNADELFYLQTRGLSPAEATRMLLMGFFEPVLGNIPLPSVRERVLAQLESGMGVG